MFRFVFHMNVKWLWGDYLNNQSLMENTEPCDKCLVSVDITIFWIVWRIYVTCLKKGRFMTNGRTYVRWQKTDPKRFVSDKKRTLNICSESNRALIVSECCWTKRFKGRVGTYFISILNRNASSDDDTRQLAYSLRPRVFRKRQHYTSLLLFSLLSVLTLCFIQ